MVNLHAVRVKETLALELEPSPRVEVRTGSGNIGVGSHGERVVHATLEMVVGAPTKERAGEVLDALRRDPPLERQGDTLRVGDLGRYSFSGASDVSVVIHVELATPFETSFGLTSGSGDIQVKAVRGPLSARAGSGSLRLVGVAEALAARTGSGEVVIEEAAGVEVQTGSGDITVRGATRVRAGSGSGDMRVHDVGEGVELETSSGTTVVSGVGGEVRAASSSGDIDVSADAPMTGAWRLATSSGDVRVALPPGSSFALQARTSSGSIRVEVPLAPNAVRGSRRVEGRTDDAPRGRLELSSSSGDIVVRPAS